jgi:hypothetical protein
LPPLGARWAPGLEGPVVGLTGNLDVGGAAGSGLRGGKFNPNGFGDVAAGALAPGEDATTVTMVSSATDTTAQGLEAGLAIVATASGISAGPQPEPQDRIGDRFPAAAFPASSETSNPANAIVV